MERKSDHGNPLYSDTSTFRVTSADCVDQFMRPNGQKKYRNSTQKQDFSQDPSLNLGKVRRVQGIFLTVLEFEVWLSANLLKTRMYQNSIEQLE